MIPLHGRNGVRGWAKVDLADFADLSSDRWLLTSTGYAARATGGRKNKRWERMHRRLLGLENGDPLEGDHKNGDTLDNRRSNLRLATHAQNQQNMRAPTGRFSTHRGVSFDTRRGKWTAWGRKDGRRVFLGRFATEVEAALAARDWRSEHMPYALD